MKNLFTLCIGFAISATLAAQETNTDEIVIRRIADFIMDNTSLTFSSADGRQTFSSTKDIPDNVEARLKSTFGEWHYTNGVLNMAMINLANFTGESKYFDYAANHVAFGMDNYKFFQKRFKGDRPHYYFPFGQLWTMRELDDCGAMGASMVDVYQKVKRSDYKEYIENTAKHITSGQQRLDDGTLVRTFPREMTI